jgi:hypothetical protein
MSACERCWTDAYLAARLHGTSQVEEYQRLLQANPNGHGPGTQATSMQGHRLHFMLLDELEEER